MYFSLSIREPDWLEGQDRNNHVGAKSSVYNNKLLSAGGGSGSQGPHFVHTIHWHQLDVCGVLSVTVMPYMGNRLSSYLCTPKQGLVSKIVSS